jgi:hypothetical protein
VVRVLTVLAVVAAVAALVALASWRHAPTPKLVPVTTTTPTSARHPAGH